MDKEFVSILAAVLEVNDQESLNAKVEELGKENLQTMYSYYQQIKESGADTLKSVDLLKQVYKKLLGKPTNMSVQYDALGAKLNYIKKLRGECPDGYEAVKFAEGGRIKTTCKKCGGNMTNKVKPAKARFGTAKGGVQYKSKEKYNTDLGTETEYTHFSKGKNGKNRTSWITKEGKQTWATDSLGNKLSGQKAREYEQNLEGKRTAKKRFFGGSL